MGYADRIPRPRRSALYAAVAIVLFVLAAGERLDPQHAEALEIAGGLAVIAILGIWVRTNRAGLDVDGLASDEPEAYTGDMSRTWAPRRWRGYAEAVLVVPICTGAARLMFRHVDESSLAMLYLAGVVLAAARGSRGAALFACLASVGAFDFFFVPPYFTLEVAESRFLVTFAVMLVVALVISELTRRVRVQGQRADTERVQSALLSSVSHDLRTPLAAITGAASTMLKGEGRLDAATRKSCSRASTRKRND